MEYFGGSYFTRMSEDYFRSLDKEAFVPYSAQNTPEGILPFEAVGFPTPPMNDQLQSLKQRIFQGVGKVELGFMGAGKGSMQGGNTTPEMYGKYHREALRDLAYLNKIELSTHATTRVGSLSGIAERQFSDEMRARALEEIRRTIDFAADVTQGGAIVVHTGEYNRPIAEREGFRMYDEEDKKRIVQFVDNQTGQIQAVRRDEVIYWPEMERNPDGTLKTDRYGSFVPKWDEEKGAYALRKFSDDDAIAVQQHFKSLGKDISLDKAKLFARIESEKRNAEAWGQNTGNRTQTQLLVLKELEENRDFLKQRWDHMTPAEQEAEKYRIISSTRGVLPQEAEGIDAFQVYDRLIRDAESDLKYSRDVATNYLEKARQLDDQMNNLEDIEEYAIKQTSKTLAEAGLYAMEKSKKMRSLQGNRYAPKDYKPLYISPENIFPEQYGAHPQELKKIVLDARKAMSDRLTHQGVSEDEAKKLAQTHIRATFDIGHANIWRKHYDQKHHKMPFEQWLVKQAEDLAKDNIIGHLHVTDNLGYNDEHLAPGEGNAPIKPFLEAMKKHGVTDLIVEGSHTDFYNLKEGWREIAGSVHQQFSAAQDSWVNIENSYFGRAASPYFLYGDLAPNAEAYQLWSQTRLE